MLRRTSPVSTALILIASMSCGGGGGGEAGPEGTIAVTASPTALTVPQGGSGTVTVTLTRGGGFADPVNVSVEGLPSGVTVGVSPAQLTGATTQATVTVNVASTVAAGTYNATVRASASGVGAVTVQYSLTVTAVTQPRVVFSVSPASLSIAQGASGTSALSITRTAFTDNITPTVSGTPAGMSVTFEPNTITGNTSLVTVNVGSSVATGTHNLVIAAPAPGNPTVTLPVTVTSGGGGGGNLVWEFCNDQPLPLRFWRKSNGAWAEVTGSVVGTTTRFSFTALGSDAGVAWVMQITSSSARASTRPSRHQTHDTQEPRQARQLAQGARARLRNASADVGGLAFPHFETTVLYATSAELSGQALVCPTRPASVSKTFNISGMTAGEVGSLGYGPGAASLTSTTASYNVTVPSGTYDYMAAFGPQPGFPDLTQNWNGYRIGRGEVAPGAAVAINRTGAPAFVTAPFTVSGGAPGSFYGFIQTFRGANSSLVALPVGSPIGTAGSGNILFLAPTDRQSTDLNSFLVSNIEPQGANNVSSRAVAQFFGPAPPAGTTTFTLPAAVPNYTVTQVTGGAYPTWTVAGSTPASFQTPRGSITVSYQGAGETTLMFVSATRNWLVAQNMATSYSLSGPAGLTGFLTQWAPAGPLIDADVTMFGSDVPQGGPVPGSLNVTSFLFKQPP